MSEIVNPLAVPWSSVRDIPGHLDMGAPAGSVVYAAEGGWATGFEDGRCGIGIQIANEDRVWTYCHLESKLRGGEVSAGDEIGLLGETGNAPSPHLHVQVKSRRTGELISYSVKRLWEVGPMSDASKATFQKVMGITTPVVLGLSATVMVLRPKQKYVSYAAAGIAAATLVAGLIARYS